MDINYNKYLKYKLKYLELKKQSGGGASMSSKSKVKDGGIVMSQPIFCESKDKTPNLKICDLYHNKVLIETLNNKIKNKENPIGHMETFINNNLINQLREDLNIINKPFNETKLINFNTLLKSKINETLLLYKKEDYTIETKQLRIENQDKIKTIKNDVLTVINKELGDMYYKENLKEILEYYFNWAYAQADDIESKEEMKAFWDSGWTVGQRNAITRRDLKQRRFGQSVDPQHQIDYDKEEKAKIERIRTSGLKTQ